MNKEFKTNDQIKVIEGKWRGERGLFIKKSEGCLCSIRLEKHGVRQIDMKYFEIDESKQPLLIEPFKKLVDPLTFFMKTLLPTTKHIIFVDGDNISDLIDKCNIFEVKNIQILLYANQYTRERIENQYKDREPKIILIPGANNGKNGVDILIARDVGFLHYFCHSDIEFMILSKDKYDLEILTHSIDRKCKFIDNKRYLNDWIHLSK